MVLYDNWIAGFPLLHVSTLLWSLCLHGAVNFISKSGNTTKEI